MLIAYLTANPQVIEKIGGSIIGLIMHNAEVNDGDKVKLQMIIDRLNTLLTKEERIAAGLDV